MMLHVRIVGYRRHLRGREDNLITKMFLFMGFNSYFSLLYIAFIKNNVCPFGQCDPCMRSSCDASSRII